MHRIMHFFYGMTHIGRILLCAKTIRSYNILNSLHGRNDIFFLRKIKLYCDYTYKEIK